MGKYNYCTITDVMATENIDWAAVRREVIELQKKHSPARVNFIVALMQAVVDGAYDKD